MISLEEAVRERHSVRQYTDEPIPEEARAALEAEIARCNAEGDLHMSLVCDEPAAFAGGLAHYGSFRGVRNYVVIAGAPAPVLEQRAGYFGERVALLAQQLGLNTCWVALTFKKRLVRRSLAAGEKLVLVISLGYGTTAGAPHKSKTAAAVSACPEGVRAPAWFERGVELALLAPTAVNQQKFRFELVADAGGVSGADSAGLPRVKATTASGPYAAVDLGIAKLHFELGAGTDSFTWADA